MTLPTDHAAGQMISAADVNAIAAGVNAGSPKAFEDASRTIYALSPSVESRLTAISADAASDDAPRLNAMLKYLKSTYGGGKLVLPYARKSNCNSTITIPAGVQVVGGHSSVWDFWYAGTAITAVVVDDHDFTPIVGLEIHGIQWEANTPKHNTTTSTGIKITGHGLNFVDVHVTGFNWGLDFTNDNTFIVGFARSSILSCMVAVNLDLNNSWTGGSGKVGNSGERMTFTDCVIANCDTAYWATGDGVGLFFVNTSIDYVVMWGRQQSAHVFFDNCHLEGTSVGRNYMFDLAVNSRLNMVNCSLVLGGTGLYYVCNPDSGPWNTGWGMAHFTNCDNYFTMTPAARTAGAINCGFSEALVPVAQGATKVIVASPFVSKWNTVKVSVVATGGNAAANVTPRITAMNVSNGTVTVTLSAAAPAGTFIEVDF